MRFVRILFFILLATLIYSTKVEAQVNLFNTTDLRFVNIDDYSDEEIDLMFKKATDAGLSTSQLLRLVSDRGLPDTEIVKLRNRLQLMNKIPRPDEEGQSEITIEGREPHEFDTTGANIPLEKFKIDETIFGSELFTTNSLVFEPNLRIPAPAGYILGPDDEIVISVYGYSEKTYTLKVDMQGEIYIPNVGPILVSGLTIEQANEKIRSRLAATIYRAINSGRTKVQVSLGKIKSIRVTVIGQAKKPGTFTVSSLTTLYNILYLCGGPTPMGSFRSIEVIRNTEKRTADLYDFLVDGNQKSNIILQEGDVIRIPYYKNRVTLLGNVKREGKYEMLDFETFSDLLRYSGGFTDNAYRGAVTVTRITDTERKIIDLTASQYSSFNTSGSDEYIVGRLQDEFGNRVVISGSVLRPGPYELTPNLTVKGLIEKAGGVTADAYTARVSIFRYLNNKLPTMLSIDLDSVLQFNQQVFLKKEDSLAVHSIFEFTDKDFVTVEGNIRKPGKVEWRERLTLRDVLLSVGGLTDLGDSTNIEIVRRIRNANVNKANHNESEIITVNLASENDLVGSEYLQPSDIVIVKTQPGYSVQRSVLVLGEVKSPGRYGLQKSGDKISDVIKRTGGFKASADSTSITIRRVVKSNLTPVERQRIFQRILDVDPDSLAENPRLKDELYKKYDLISVDLATALSHPRSSENLALEAGDILTVDRSSNLVKISGEVYYPTIAPYKPNKNLKYYVQQAGSFTNYARKTGALVIHPDGKAESVKHFLWFRSYPSVTPRSEIFVPQKARNNRARLGTGELALIVSALGIIANVIVNLK